MLRRTISQAQSARLKQGVSESYIRIRPTRLAPVRKKPGASAGLTKFGDGGVLEKEDDSSIVRFA